MKKYAAIVLAAGASKRMGKPKQLLPYRGTTLLSHGINQLIALDALDVYVVLGAYADAIQLTLHNAPVHTVQNTHWESGMGTSLSCGITEVERYGNYQAVLVTLSDLPLVDISHYQKLINEFEKGNSLVITKYKHVKGVPVILSDVYFPELRALKGDEGAKPVIQKYKERVSEIESETPYFDVDTDESYQKLINLS